MPDNKIYEYTLIRIKKLDGHVTTVSLEPSLYVKLSAKFGGPKQVNCYFRTLAKTLSPDPSMSLSRQLREAAISAPVPAAPVA